MAKKKASLFFDTIIYMSFCLRIFITIIILFSHSFLPSHEIDLGKEAMSGQSQQSFPQFFSSDNRKKPQHDKTNKMACASS